MKVIIYFDMDGVLYPWNEQATIEDTFVSGYFNQDRIQQNIVDAVKRLYDAGYDVQVATAVYPLAHVIDDKNNWLDRYSLQDIPRHFIPYNVGSKKDITDPDCINILIDDFTKNLKQWTEAQDGHYIGVKFFNQVNAKNGYGSWHGPSVSYHMSADELFFMISAIADKAMKGDRKCS